MRDRCAGPPAAPRYSGPGPSTWLVLVATQEVGGSIAPFVLGAFAGRFIRLLQQRLRVGQAGGRTSAIRRARSIR